jgi:plasmid stabilization system protein ParE
MRVIVLPQAEEDISESALFISEDSLDSALHFIERTREAFEFLSRHPEVGSNLVWNLTYALGIALVNLLLRQLLEYLT